MVARRGPIASSNAAFAGLWMTGAVMAGIIRL